MLITYEMSQLLRTTIHDWLSDEDDVYGWRAADHDERVSTALTLALDAFNPLDYADLHDLAGAISDAGEPVTHPELLETLGALVERGSVERRQGGSYDVLVGPTALFRERERPHLTMLTEALADSDRPMSREEVAQAVMDAGGDISVPKAYALLRMMARSGDVEMSSGRMPMFRLLRRDGQIADSVESPNPIPEASPAGVGTAAAGRRPLVSSDHGILKPEVVCPHCQVKGNVYTKSVERKSGISGGKATAAVITGGLSVLATGLSEKQDVTQAYCENCKVTWDI